MPFAIDIERQPEFVRFALRGVAFLPDFVEAINTIETETVFWSDRNALFDLRGVDGELPAEEQVFLGVLVGQSLSHLYRLASVVPAVRLTRRSEGAAQQLGVQLRVFDDPAQAVDWLVEGHAQSMPGLLEQAEGLKRLLNGREIP